MGRFDGKVAFVTGGARGQGRSHAVRLAAEGADVAVVDVVRQFDSVQYAMSTPEDLAETEKLVREQGREFLGIPGDVRDEEQVAAAVGQVEQRFGGIDLVCANAGILPSTGPHAQRMSAWHDTIATNLSGVFYTLRAVTPGMVERGRGGAIVLTGSTSTFRGVAYKLEMLNPGHMAYGAAKSGVLSLMRNYAMALGTHGIRVNTVIPAGVDTPMTNNEFFTKDLQADAPPGWMANVMEHGLVQPGDISDAVLFLLSDQAKFVTGVALPVDMGTLLI
ncbi:SDR family mycofactocin-dependent oxidoreductase [Geodermatophilus sp. TF02-6]|uniref:mycofactocin-coupled SDR family oxidoreductase n=1 Tax=Geodermatophilus sp. TF02-6 TaxID=2250575 RepID=UPI000DE8F52B|nr:mycofactocin-coupled SDR family oxidoreductase [Geodermatophilus sp. TF02-6]RBY83695.1 SDR family mycofactocin-dependent oxidoreductase [Geodermatophilus sp. TF02-6]